MFVVIEQLVVIGSRLRGDRNGVALSTTMEFVLAEWSEDKLLRRRK